MMGKLFINSSSVEQMKVELMSRLADEIQDFSAVYNVPEKVKEFMTDKSDTAVPLLSSNQWLNEFEDTDLEESIAITTSRSVVSSSTTRDRMVNFTNDPWEIIEMNQVTTCRYLEPVSHGSHCEQEEGPHEVPGDEVDHYEEHCEGAHDQGPRGGQEDPSHKEQFEAYANLSGVQQPASRNVFNSSGSRDRMTNFTTNPWEIIEMTQVTTYRLLEPVGAESHSRQVELSSHQEEGPLEVPGVVVDLHTEHCDGVHGQGPDGDKGAPFRKDLMEGGDQVDMEVAPTEADNPDEGLALLAGHHMPNVHYAKSEESSQGEQLPGHTEHLHREQHHGHNDGTLDHELFHGHQLLEFVDKDHKVVQQLWTAGGEGKIQLKAVQYEANFVKPLHVHHRVGGDKARADEAGLGGEHHGLLSSLLQHDSHRVDGAQADAPELLLDGGHQVKCFSSSAVYRHGEDEFNTIGQMDLLTRNVSICHVALVAGGTEVLLDTGAVETALLSALCRFEESI